MTTKLRYILTAFALTGYSTFALAGAAGGTIPEPGTISLLAGGAVAAVALWRWRGRK